MRSAFAPEPLNGHLYVFQAVFRSSMLKEVLPGTRGNATDMETHDRAMEKFVIKSYGAPGAKPRLTTNAVGDPEVRRSVAASGLDDVAIVSDIGRAARTLAKDETATKVVSLVFHGNATQSGRVSLGSWVTSDKLRAVTAYRIDLFSMERDLQKVRGKIKKDPTGYPDDEISSREERISPYKEANAKIGALSDALAEASRELELAGVSVVELQGCNVADDPTFSNRLSAYLSNADNRVRVGAFSSDVVSDVHAGTFIGVEDPAAPNGITEQSTTNLPTPDRH